MTIRKKNSVAKVGDCICLFTEKDYLAKTPLKFVIFFESFEGTAAWNDGKGVNSHMILLDHNKSYPFLALVLEVKKIPESLESSARKHRNHVSWRSELAYKVLVLSLNKCLWVCDDQPFDIVCTSTT